MELVGCGTAGALVWALLVVGRTGDDVVPLGFWVAMAGLVAALALVVRGNLAGAAFLGPMVLALWTAPRGDNDGLWMITEFLLIAGAGIGGMIATGVHRLVPRSPWSPHPWLAGVVVLATAVGTVLLIVDRRPDPYPELERIVAGFPAPASFEAEGVRRGGDPLCNEVCGPFVEARFTTAASPEEACTALGTALDGWRGVEAEPSAPIFNPEAGWYEICRWDIEGGSAVVDDEPDGTVIGVTVAGKRGGWAGVGA